MKAAAALLGLAIAGPALAQSAQTPAIPAYQPQQTVSGEVRVWASPDDGALLQSWAEGFRRQQPQARVVATLHGPESTMAGVYNGVADLAFMAREMRLPVEDMAFTWVYQYKPFSVEIANAGLGPGRPSSTLAVFVHRDNPLQQLTLQQLDGIFGAEHRRGPQNLRRWGELGLPEPRQSRPIHLYGPAIDGVQALFIRSAVLQDSYKWNPDYRELPEDGKPDDGSQAVSAVAADPDGIAFGAAGLGEANPQVKVLPLADAAGGPFELPDAASIRARRYPLTRVVTMVLNRPPGKPVAPAVKEFLRYILSAEGQAAVARDGSYIPLSAESVQQQRAHLE